MRKLSSDVIHHPKEVSVSPFTSLDDVTLLQKISQTTFSQAFSSQNNPDDLKAYMDRAFDIEKLTTEIQNPESSFYVATCGKERDSKMMGYLKLNTGAAHLVDPLEIERIYVLNEYQGRGVGKTLFDTALEFANTHNCQHIWLGVWEHNDKALRFYEKHGFEPFGSHIFQMGPDEQIDVLMRKKLGLRP